MNDATLPRQDEKGLEAAAATNRLSIYQKTARGDTSRMNLENALSTPQQAQNINVDIQTAGLNPTEAHRIINSANLENLDERSEIADTTFDRRNMHTG